MCAANHIEPIRQLRGRRVLVSPLNWGLGHATRCIPIIRALIAEGKTVIIAATGAPLTLLRRTFPNLQFIDFEGISIKYSHCKSQTATLLGQVPRAIAATVREHRQLRQIVREHQIDTVIADNRFGLFGVANESIYITHQIFVKLPKALKIFEPLAWRIHRFFINRYDKYWIPDNQELQLAGELAHKHQLPKNSEFIGILSRFEGQIIDKKNADFTYQTVAIVSGPEPQRTAFEEQLVAHYQHHHTRTLVVRGTPNAHRKTQEIGSVTLVDHLPDSELLPHLLGCETIVCRSGYSTLMDLVTIGRSAKLNPTPGQTEQEYLATHALKFGFETWHFEPIK